MDLRYIDAHNHLYDKQFESDIDDVIQRAKEVGVDKTVVVSENAGDCPDILKLVNRFPEFCTAGFGVHPVQGEDGISRSVCQKDLDELMPWIENHHERLVCIGEVGLDFTPYHCTGEDSKESQRHVLTQLVKVADQYNLPLNVHSRSAGRPTVALLKSTDARDVLLHAFDGKTSVALEGASCGFYFSVPPSIVRSEQKVKIVKALPLDRLLLETDSPALGPEKLERNEPQNVRLSCAEIARIKGLPADDVAKITRENSLRLFHKLNTDV